MTALAWITLILAVLSSDAAADDRISVRTLEAGPENGHAYRLEYLVNVPLEVFWNFKTDFQGSFLTSSRQIQNHRFLRQEGNIVYTEVRYSALPGRAFLWKTRVLPERHQLEFRLLNAENIGHRFHRGSIALFREEGGTRVVQTAAFDFRGALLWVHYPWKGGMSSFLRSIATWERQTAYRLRDHYAQP